MNGGPHGKTAFFDRFARDGDAMRFGPGDKPKLALLRARLGDLRGLRLLEPGGSVDAFDASGEMLARCRSAVADRRNVRLTQVRCEEAEFPAGAFDRVVCFRVLPHFDDLDGVLARFARWLRPGGRLHIVHWEGRAALAAIHGGCASLAQDVLPPSAELAAALARHGFSLITAIDDAHEIYLEAVRPGRSR